MTVNFKDMRQGLFTLLILVLASCSNDSFDITTPLDLNGEWIEVKTKTDTLTFNSWDNLEVMTLSRGKEMRDGHLLPKAGSGPYEYKLQESKISLYWMLSSNYTFKDYSFRRTGNKLTIDNFYNSTLGASLTFEKIN